MSICTTVGCYLYNIHLPQYETCQILSQTAIGGVVMLFVGHVAIYTVAVIVSAHNHWRLAMTQ